MEACITDKIDWLCRLFAYSPKNHIESTLLFCIYLEVVEYFVIWYDTTRGFSNRNHYLHPFDYGKDS
jgi:hypothetical protein